MATPEFPMFVTRRTALFNKPVPGFYLVPPNVAAALRASGAASDTFDGMAVVNNEPPITLTASAALKTPHAKPDSPESFAVADLTAGGGTAPYQFIIVNTDGGNFKIAGTEIQTAKTGITAGNHTVTFIARDAENHISGIKSVAVPIDAPAVARTASKK